MIFSACPPIYHLPGTWSDPDKIAKCNDTLFPHGHFAGLSPEGQMIAVIVALLAFLVGYGLYLTFGPGKEELRDAIDEHAKMHELGIAHGHGGNKDAYKISGKLNHDHPDSLLG
tara:strand:- start:74 stop:415 length:342 start_codon:yes stop_codon:yes gene_type:complete